MMKLYQVTLRDGRDILVQADSYQKDGNQYVFPNSEHPDDVQWYLIDEVLGISLAESAQDSGHASGRPPKLPGM